MKIHAIEGIEMLEVIQIKIVAGTGKDKSDPLRPAFQYWSKDGALLATDDPHSPDEENQP